MFYTFLSKATQIEIRKYTDSKLPDSARYMEMDRFQLMFVRRQLWWLISERLLIVEIVWDNT